MRAVVCPRYGPPEVLEVREVPAPEPRDGEVLVAVRAAGLNAADRRLMRADPWLVRLARGLRVPRVTAVGCEVAGTVAALGPGTERFRVGDAVMADVSSSGWGAFADYVRLPERLAAPLPRRASFEEAATLPLAGGTALGALRAAGVADGERVLVDGASGGVGTFAVQIARALGAHVTATCRPHHVDLVRSLGADEVVEDPRDGLFDVVLGVNGDRPLSRYRDLLAPGGRYLMVGGTTRQMLEALAFARLRSSRDRRLATFTAAPDAELLTTLAQWFDEGRLRTVVDRRFALDDVVAAMHHLEQGPAAGKSVLTMGAGPSVTRDQRAAEAPR
ncbi:NAD(P)-dependent alcohol dehydrogenase [Actinomycetospora sp. CA-053990]|uniref:NAD(P)-dependent alcohol dehydrogenase n=1 Tax=Actinomycetospora sp. CA-053990 TaxID=3239891 RepID=UPI003D94EE85